MGPLHTTTLKSRAIAFAMTVGAVAFILALLAAMSPAELTGHEGAQALIAAIVCATFCWAAAERAVAAPAEAMDAAIIRIGEAADGDFASPVADNIHAALPDLGRSMQALLQQVEHSFTTIHRLAMFDPVTGLANRVYFRDASDAAMADAGDGDVHALLFIDLDRFKAVNDRMGHASGDMLLARVAERLRAMLEERGIADSVLLGRLAGDEFVMLVSGIDDAGGLALGEAVVDALARPFAVGGQSVTIGASVGVAARPLHGRSSTRLMRAADTAMYRAKEQGGGRAVLYSAAIASSFENRAQLEGELRSAIAGSEFVLHYQPQLDLRSGEMVAAEALLRWTHGASGRTRMPGEFLARAEASGMMIEIGDWAVDAFVAALARWTALGLTQRIGINLSPRQIDNDRFFDRLEAVIGRADVPINLLELEITESCALQLRGDVLASLARLREAGMSVAIDDFGAGLSSIPRLASLPINRIKIERGLIADIVDSARARDMLHATVGVIHSLGCEAVAEGVEAQAQLEVLRVIGCDLAQGYAIAPPMAEEMLVGWIEGRPVRAVS